VDARKFAATARAPVKNVWATMIVVPQAYLLVVLLVYCCHGTGKLSSARTPTAINYSVHRVLLKERTHPEAD